MKLFKYYKNAVIYPSIFVLFFCLVYSVIENYAGDPLPLQSVIQMSVIPALIFSLLICLLSLTIFLNKIKKLNGNMIWSLMTWFLLPFVYILIVLVHDLQLRIKMGFGFGNDFMYHLIMILPFIIGLSRTFTQYRNDISPGIDVKDNVQSVPV